MNRLAVVTSVAVSLFMLAGTALAASGGITGKIRSVDVDKRSVTLANGQQFSIPEAIELKGFKADDQVVVSLEQDAKGYYHVKTFTKAGQQKN